MIRKVPCILLTHGNVRLIAPGLRKIKKASTLAEELAGWLKGWLAGRLAGWLPAAGLTGWLIGLLAGWGSRSGWRPHWLECWQAGWLAGKPQRARTSHPGAPRRPIELTLLRSGATLQRFLTFLACRHLRYANSIRKTAHFEILWK